MIKRIVLDLDDTLNSLTLHILRYLGCNVEDYDYHLFPVDCGYDIEAAYHRIKPPHLPDLNRSQFWNSIPRSVWANAPRSREFEFLCGHSAALVGQENVCILTSPTKDPESLAGKLEWIHSACPEWLHRQFLIGPRKHFCARPDTLLVDDSDENVKTFKRHGGQAILVPRPWNSLHNENTRSHLEREFYRLFSQAIA